MCVRLAATIARRRHTHKASIQPILQIALQNTIFNQHGAARGRAFVINGQAPAPIGQRPIIHHRNAGRRHTLANTPGKYRGAFAVEITLQPVTNGFMQQNAGPTSAQHNFHGTGWRRLGFQRNQRLPQSFIHSALPCFFIQQTVDLIPATQPVTAAFTLAIMFHHNRYIQPHQWAQICRPRAIGPHDLHRLPFPRKGGHNLHHAAIFATCIGIYF